MYKVWLSIATIWLDGFPAEQPGELTPLQAAASFRADPNPMPNPGGSDTSQLAYAASQRVFNVFIEEQAFLPSYDLAPFPSPLPPESFLSQSSCVSRSYYWDQQQKKQQDNEIKLS